MVSSLLPWRKNASTARSTAPGFHARRSVIACRLPISQFLISIRRLPSLSGLIAARLANAAKVHDLHEELARALSVSPELPAKFHKVEHHRAHMASCFLVSPFERAAILSIDGFGDFISTMWGIGENNHIDVLGQVEYPHSAGIVYTATSQYLGFPKYGDE